MSSLSNEGNKSKAKLKWFNAAKGFGFVVPEGTTIDAFLHITQLQKMGIHGLGEGAEVVCVVEQTEKGAIVTDLIEIISIGAAPEGAVVPEMSPQDGVYKIKGIVKLYFEDKGFGFVTPDDGMKDIFVHKSCLDSCGVAELHPGQRVRISFKLANKGREAVEIQIESNP
jgi:CspA family cold shock protein